jgi:hypothetical protein
LKTLNNTESVLYQHTGSQNKTKRTKKVSQQQPKNHPQQQSTYSH